MPRNQVAEVIFLWVGLLVSISLIIIVSLFSKTGYKMMIGREATVAKQAEMYKVAKATPFVDRNRLISGDDVVEFISDMGYTEEFVFWLKEHRGDIILNDLPGDVTTTVDGQTYIVRIVRENTELYKDAMNKVLKSIDEEALGKGDAKMYAETALWSQYYLSGVVLGNNYLLSKYQPKIYRSKSADEEYIPGHESNWTEWMSEEHGIPVTYADVAGGDMKYFIVYIEQ